jgi:predicted nuclease with TOPRIM domain
MSISACKTLSEVLSYSPESTLVEAVRPHVDDLVSEVERLRKQRETLDNQLIEVRRRVDAILDNRRLLHPHCNQNPDDVSRDLLDALLQASKEAETGPDDLDSDDLDLAGYV